MQLWLRIGDNGEYHAHDDLKAVTDELAENQVFEIGDWRDGGFTVYGAYEGGNYVSLYWGDGESNHKHDLSKTEKDSLSELLALAKILSDTNEQT